MGNVLDPKPPQWERKRHITDVEDDRVLLLAQRLLEVLTSEVNPTVAQLAALRLVQKSIITNYLVCMGAPAANELLRQAKELASNYVVQGPNGEEEA